MHFAETRMLELAQGASPGAGEAAHLAACASCAGRLRAESRVSAFMRKLPRPEPPAGFAARVQQQFAVVQRRQRRQALAALAFGLVTSLLVVAISGAVVIANAAPLTQSAIELLAGLAVAGQALVTVLKSAPFLGVILVAATVTAALACLYTVRRTALAYAGVK